jgi:hypothetical protein
MTMCVKKDACTVTSFQPQLPSHYEESSVAIQDSESGREGEGNLSERNESHAAHPNVIDVVIVS